MTQQNEDIIYRGTCRKRSIRLERIRRKYAKGCAVGAIKGAYGLAGTGISSQGGPTLQYALLGKIEFSGSGAVTGTQSINIGGRILRGPVTGSNQVRSDCSGALTRLVPGGNTTFDLLIPKGENEILLIETVPGEIAAGSLKRM